MLPDRVSNPGPLTYESGALPIALRGPAKDLEKKLSHLEQSKCDELKMLILEYEDLFSHFPTRTDKIYHYVDVEDSNNIHIE